MSICKSLTNLIIVLLYYEKTIVNNLDLGYAYYAWKQTSNDAIWYMQSTAPVNGNPVYSSSLFYDAMVDQVNSDGTIIIRMRTSSSTYRLERYPEDDIEKNLIINFGHGTCGTVSYGSTIFFPQAYRASITAILAFPTQPGTDSTLKGAISAFIYDNYISKSYFCAKGSYATASKAGYESYKFSYVAIGY